MTMNATETTQQTTLATMRQPMNLAAISDQAVDMFTERGFALANRIAKAYASSDAVPAQFRAFNLKKVGRDEKWVENPNAIGNCLVAIEVARAVRMSITAVMQNADMIEGKLRWSGKFVIAAINASGRFTPLRFQMRNLGPIEAAYKEKTGWDDQARRPIFTERKVKVENIECIAWALPKGYPEPAITADQLRQYPNRMLDLYKALGVPVIESAPVTMRMAVEEGWYGKPGSKWQTEMRTLMFYYRSGSYFGNVHAPDIVMGMGQTSEEARDLMTFDVAADGTVTPTPISELRRAPAGPVPAAEIVEQAGATVNSQTGEITEATQAMTFAQVADAIGASKDTDTLDMARGFIEAVPDAQQQAELNRLAAQQLAAIRASSETAGAGQPQPAQRARRERAAAADME